MLHPFIDFKPAQLSVNKNNTYVSFYAINPFTKKMERKRIRINHIKGKTERMKYGRLLCLKINEKLYNGWNPFLEEKQSKAKIISDGIRDFLAEKAKSSRPDTLRSYTSYCKCLNNWLKRNSMDKDMIALFSKDVAKQFMKSLENDSISNTTYNNYLSFMLLLFNHFISFGYIGDNPFNGIKPKRKEEKRRLTIPKEERERIKDYFLRENPYFYRVMLLCYRLLLRPKEILMLKIGDIDFENLLIKVPSDVAKNHHSRVLGIPDDLSGLFINYRGFSPSLFIFSTDYIPGKKMLNTRYIGKTWAQMRKELGLPTEYQFYSLKDTGITEMLESGMPAKLVMDLAGHHSLDMTEKYTHRSDAKKILEWNRLKF